VKLFLPSKQAESFSEIRHYFTFDMKAAKSLEMLLITYETTCCHNLGNQNLKLPVIITSNLIKVATPVDEMMHRQVAQYKSINACDATRGKRHYFCFISR